MYIHSIQFFSFRKGNATHDTLEEVHENDEEEEETKKTKKKRREKEKRKRDSP